MSKKPRIQKHDVKLETFVNEWMIDQNATRAGIEAGFSEKSAASQANRLLKNVKVQKMIADRQKAIAAKLEITQEKVLAEYAGIAFFDPMEMYDADGVLLQVREMQPHVRRAIMQIEFEETYIDSDDDGPVRRSVGRTVKIKLHPKIQALDTLRDRLNLLPARRMELTGRNGGPIETKPTVDLSKLDEATLQKLAALGDALK